MRTLHSLKKNIVRPNISNATKTALMAFQSYWDNGFPITITLQIPSQIYFLDIGGYKEWETEHTESWNRDYPGNNPADFNWGLITLVERIN